MYKHSHNDVNDGSKWKLFWYRREIAARSLKLTYVRNVQMWLAQVVLFLGD